MLADTGQNPTVSGPEEAGSGSDGEGIETMVEADRDGPGRRRRFIRPEIGMWGGRGHKSRLAGHTVGVETSFRAETGASPHELFVVVSDLNTYPHWIELVHRVEPIAAGGDGTGGRGAEPTWFVTLRARLGPLARSKRLRMARTTLELPADNGDQGFVRFDRREIDGRDHAPWTMEVTVEPAFGSALSVAVCRLCYGGGMWDGLLAASLDIVARRAVTRLQDLVGPPGSG